jgi:hypothetical protein
MQKRKKSKEVIIASALNPGPKKILGIVASAAAVAGGIIDIGLRGGAQSLSRIIQEGVKGRLKEQFLTELGELIQKGKVRPDFLSDIRTRGFQSFVELLKFLDSEEVLDNEKFIVLKKIFISIVETDISNQQENLRYQLFTISKQLSSAQILILATNYKLFKNGLKDGGHDRWITEIANNSFDGIKSLVEAHEDFLERQKLIGKRRFDDGTGITLRENFRLTDLGLRLAEYLIEKEK